MKRVLVRRPGGHEALEIVEEDDPLPGPGQVRVRACAAGINYADTIVREGWYEAAKGCYPLTPGFEFAGVVDLVGASADSFKPGDRVFGFTRFGGYASVQIAEPGRLRLCPSGWDFTDCAGLPAVHFTAYHALFQVAKIVRGETILVHSAAGGVGTALLQQAKIAGCRVVGVVGCGPRKAAVASEFGADIVVARSRRLWAEIDAVAPEGFDAIFDANGVTTPRPGFERLKLGGRLVIYGFAEMFPRGGKRAVFQRILEAAFPLRMARSHFLALWLGQSWLRVPRFSPLAMTAANRSVMGFNIVFLTDRAELAKDGFDAICAWARAGLIRKSPVTAFPLERVADAHRALESGDTVGKIVLTL